MKRARSSIALSIVPAFSTESSTATMRRARVAESRTPAGDRGFGAAALPRKSQVTLWRPLAPGPGSVRIVSPLASTILMLARVEATPSVTRYQRSAP